MLFRSLDFWYGSSYIEHDLDAVPANPACDLLQLGGGTVGTTEAGLYKSLSILNEQLPGLLVGAGRDLHQF